MCEDYQCMVVGINPVTVEWWWVALTRGFIRDVPVMAKSLHTNTNGGHSRNSLHIIWIVSAWKFSWKLLFFGKNTPHFYKNKNIIYSLLSPPM